MQQSDGDPKSQRRLPPCPGWDNKELLPFERLEPELSLWLWQRARDVRLWAGTPPQRRRDLFQPGREFGRAAEIPEALRPAVAILDRLVASPAEQSAAETIEACRTVMGWAESASLLHVALHYADAWAYLDQDSPEAASTAGHYCTRAGEFLRAEAWLVRAIALGRRSRDWEWYIRSFIRRGILRYEVGDYRRARRYAIRALNKATWSGHDKLGAMACHDLLAVAIHTGSFTQGQRFALRALEMYPLKIDRVRHLTHDFALFLAVRACFSTVHRPLRTLEPLFPPEDPMRVLWLATSAQVAAGVGDAPLFDRLAAEVLTIVEQRDEQAAIALLRVADGMRRFGAWNDAESIAARCLQLALRRGEREPQLGAYQLLDEIGERNLGGGDRPPPAEVQPQVVFEALFERLARQHRLGVLAAAVTL